MVKIPTRLEELLPAGAMEKVLNALSQPEIPASVREALGKLGWKDAKNPLGQVQEAWQQARTWLESVVDLSPKTERSVAVLNATGSLFAHGLDYAPQSTSAAYGYAKAATSFQNGAHLKARAHEIAQSLFGKRVAWVQSPAVAVRSLAATPSAKAGVVISRADAVRVPGFGDVRNMLTAWNGTIEEIGAANGASPSDWEQTLAEKKLLLLVSPNNLGSEAATAQRAAAIEVARRVGVRVAELLIDGIACSEPSQSAQQSYSLGLPDVRRRLSEGADLVLLPTHLLLAGPNGMLVVGDEQDVRAIDTAAAAVSEQMTGPTMAAATLALQLAMLTDNPESGLLAALHVSPDNLKSRARRLAVQLNDTPFITDAVEVERDCPLGPTPWDRYHMKNWGIRLTPRQSLDQLKRMLENDSGDVAGTRLPLMVASSGNELIVDLRFIAPEDDHEIVIACGCQPDA